MKIKAALIDYSRSSFCSLQQCFELIEFNLARSIFVNLLDEPLNIDRHLELVFNSVNQLFGVDTAASVFVTAHGDIGIEKL